MILSSSVSWYCVDPWEIQQVNGIDKIRQIVYFCVKLIDMWHAVNWQFSWIVLCTKYLLSKFLCRLIMCLYQHNLKKWSVKSFYCVWFYCDLSVYSYVMRPYQSCNVAHFQLFVLTHVLDSNLLLDKDLFLGFLVQLLKASSLCKTEDKPITFLTI